MHPYVPLFIRHCSISRRICGNAFTKRTGHKSPARAPNAFKAQRKAIYKLLSVAVALPAASPCHHRTSHYLAPAFLRLIQAMYESPYWPRVLMMGPSGR